MRPLFIDFLADPSASTGGTKWARRALWSGALLLVAAEAAVFLEWRGDNERLGRQLGEMSRESSHAAAAQPSIEPAHQLKASQAFAAVSSFDPIALSTIEQGVMKVRSRSPEARLQIRGLSFEARQRRIVLQGQSLEHHAVNQLREEILLLLPQAAVGFPSLHDRADRGLPLQFEIGIRLSPLPGSDR